MATAEAPTRVHDRHARRRPFTNWMKRLANLKSTHNEPTTSKNHATKKRTTIESTKESSPQIRSPKSSTGTPHTSRSSAISRQSSGSRARMAASVSQDGELPVKSRAPTLATTAETTYSAADTTATAAQTEGDRDSTFSSPAHSVRSLTTTLTTIQSTTPALNGAAPNTNYQSTQPASAVPPHLVPHNQPATYHIATANGVLTDDASILTLASSSKRRRRNSLDTNASIKALAPQSMFGGSRESLPLSVLSGSAQHVSGPRDTDNTSLRDNGSVHYPRSISAMNVERASLISASGVTAPALTSERNSYVSSRPTGDTASVRSGLFGLSDRDRSLYHARNDSIGGLSVTRERFRDTPRDTTAQHESSREQQSVTAPTTPLTMP